MILGEKNALRHGFSSHFPVPSLSSAWAYHQLQGLGQYVYHGQSLQTVLLPLPRTPAAYSLYINHAFTNAHCCTWTYSTSTHSLSAQFVTINPVLQLIESPSGILFE